MSDAITPANTTTAIEEAEFREVATADSLGSMLSQPSAWFCSLKPQTDEDRSLIYRARVEKLQTIGDLIGAELVVNNIALQQVEYTSPFDQTIQQGVRVVLFCQNGLLVSSLSTGVLESTKALAASFGLPPWPTGIRVKPRQETLGNGRKRFLLELIGIVSPAIANRKKG